MFCVVAYVAVQNGRLSGTSFAFVSVEWVRLQEAMAFARVATGESKTAPSRSVLTGCERRPENGDPAGPQED